MSEYTLFDRPVLFMICCELMLITTFLQANQIKRKKALSRKIIAAIILVTVILILEYYFVDFNNATTTMEPIFCLIGTYVYAVVILKYRRRETFYWITWSYLLTEIATQILMPLGDLILKGKEGIWFNIFYIIFYLCGIAGITLFVKKILISKLQIENQYHIGKQKILYCFIVSGGYFLFSNYQFIFWILGNEPEKGSNMITIFRLTVGIAGILFLYIQNNLENIQKSEQELNMMQQLMYRQQEQYQISQENIELINRKCHDLRYQMEALRKLKDEHEIDTQLKELERSVMIYDSIIKTGNPVLDTVLTEKSLICEANQINMTCMADGEKLNFIGKIDLYTMFGNALDNAIECVMKQEDVSKRIIQIAVFYEKNLLMIRIRNYCEEKLKLQDGIPISTKQDKNYHGFGLKSIQYTAEKYGGGIVCQNFDNYFVLQILLPISED